MRKITVFVLVVIMTLPLLCACRKDNVELDIPEFSEFSDKMSDKDNPVALIKIKDMGYMIVELYYDIAPNTVKNFISLAKCGFYDGLIFHRVIPNFMIQGGDPKGNGSGGPGYDIKGEFSNNGFENNLKHTRGVISMAREGNPYNPALSYNTAGSQFFIMVADSPGLDGDYASFGYCIEGMNIADKIVSVQCNSADKPLKDVVIESVTIVDHGIDYGEPETIM